MEQDRIFWSQFLHPERGGTFLEIGGDGVTGSHTLGLELRHGWGGEFCESETPPRQNAQGVRKCRVVGSLRELSISRPINLMAIRRPAECAEAWKLLGSKDFCPQWVVIENRDPDPKWCRLLEGRGYRLKFFFHDDEYYQWKR